MSFGMQDMIADILAKMIPPETLKLVSPENLSNMGQQAAEFVNEIREKLDLITMTQADNHIAVMSELQEMRKELLDAAGSRNNGSPSSSSGSGSRKRSGSAD